MEVSTKCRFNNLQFRPSLHIHNFRNKEARISFSTSLNPLDSYGFSIQFPAFKHSCWRISNKYALPLQFSRIPRLRERKFCKNYSNSLHKQYKSSRYIAVRSEVAGTGSANAACPLSELQFVPRTRGVLFYAITSIVAIFLFKLMVVAHPFVLLFDQYQRKAHHLIAKIWSLLTISPFFPIEFEGLENLPPQETAAVYVSNHRSFLDIYTLLTLGRSFKFISKTSIFLFPVIGWAMYFLGTIPLKRMDSRSQMDCLKRCMDLIKKGASVFFFPEGTRSKDGKLGTFKKGAFSIAVKTKVPVIPITLMGTGDIMPAGLEEKRLQIHSFLKATRLSDKDLFDLKIRLFEPLFIQRNIMVYAFLLMLEGLNLYLLVVKSFPPGEHYIFDGNFKKSCFDLITFAMNPPVRILSDPVYYKGQVTFYHTLFARQFMYTS